MERRFFSSLTWPSTLSQSILLILVPSLAGLLLPRVSDAGPREQAVASPPLTAPATVPGPLPTSGSGSSSGVASLFLSEFLADPAAVADRDGEWIELYNRGDAPQNLRDWVLADGGRDRHRVERDLWIGPGSYLVLGRNPEPAVNGGVPVEYVYQKFSLANSEDEIHLYDPQDRLVDSVSWGPGGELSVVSGASLARPMVPRIGRWIQSQKRWPGSAGDAGSPGFEDEPSLSTPWPTATHSPPPSATVGVDLPTPTHPPTNLPTSPPATRLPLPSETPAPTGTPLPPQTSTSTPTPHSLPTGTSVPPGTLWLSEFLADPAVVGDSVGEWIELLNTGSQPISLEGWSLVDEGQDRHKISGPLQIGAGEVLLLARNGETNQNGGVVPNYVYSGISLSNQEDEILLLDPSGKIVDQVRWGAEREQQIVPGASLMRLVFSGAAMWQLAQTTWPGSAGDLGSPGTANVVPVPTSTPVVPSITPTIKPTASSISTPTTTPVIPTSTVAPSPTTTATKRSATLTPSHTPIPTGSVPSLTPSATGVPTERWIARAETSPLLIEELYFEGNEEEFVVVQNVSEERLQLGGWRIGDAETPNDREGLYFLPDIWLEAGALFSIARDGDAFESRWGEPPQAAFIRKGRAETLLERDDSASRGNIALSDRGDEVVLIDPAGQLADAVSYGQGEGTLLALSGKLDPDRGLSLQRIPGFRFPDVLDQRFRFFFAPPLPFAAVELPEPSFQDAPVLDGGLYGVWGSLGAVSLFSPLGTMPPHLVEMSAASIGLNFVALADPPGSPIPEPLTNLIRVPAWRWRSGNEEAIVYGASIEGLDRWELLQLSQREMLPIQWVRGKRPSDGHIVAVPADNVLGGDRFFDLLAGTDILLAAGNAQPPGPGYLPVRSLYTGLAVSVPDGAGIREALLARRGWLTSQPGLAITLRARTDSDHSWRWMGSPIQGGRKLEVVVELQDSHKEATALALWQNGAPLAERGVPMADGVWHLEIDGKPGLLVAVATQADGDVGFSAPILVQAIGSPSLLLNEALPRPGRDWNGDGLIDSGDEFIEVINPGPAGAFADGWEIQDGPLRRRFTIVDGTYLEPGDRLLLWGSDTGIGLNNENEELRLLNPESEVIDTLAWALNPGWDRAYLRSPDGGEWRVGDPTPGEANPYLPPPLPPPTSLPPWGSGAAPGAPGGESPGAFGSVARAKIAGLGRSVSFRGVVVVPPGLFNAAIYVADPAGGSGEVAGIGIQVYLPHGAFPPLSEGDWVEVHGVLDSFRGEKEVILSAPDQIWPIERNTPLKPLGVSIANVGESLEGRLVRLEGHVVRWRGSSIFLADKEGETEDSLEVHVRSSLPWRRPFVNPGDLWQVTGIVTQFARAAPWNGGYRILPRYPGDLERRKPP